MLSEAEVMYEIVWGEKPHQYGPVSFTRRVGKIAQK